MCSKQGVQWFRLYFICFYLISSSTVIYVREYFFIFPEEIHLSLNLFIKFIDLGFVSLPHPLKFFLLFLLLLRVVLVRDIIFKLHKIPGIPFQFIIHKIHKFH